MVNIGCVLIPLPELIPEDMMIVKEAAEMIRDAIAALK